jgi:hypothetical protein
MYSNEEVQMVFEFLICHATYLIGLGTPFLQVDYNVVKLMTLQTLHRTILLFLVFPEIFNISKNDRNKIYLNEVFMSHINFCRLRHF